MSVDAVSHTGSPTATAGSTASGAGGIVDLGRVRAARADRPRTARQRLVAHRRATLSDAVGHVARTGRPPVHAAMVVEREYAITVRTGSVADAQQLAHAIERVVPALIAPGVRRCRIEARARAAELPSIMVECAAGDPQALDTLLRSLESITGTRLRAKVIIHGADHPYVRTWVGSWVEWEPRRGQSPGFAGPPLRPAAA